MPAPGTESTRNVPPTDSTRSDQTLNAAPAGNCRAAGPVVGHRDHQSPEPHRHLDPRRGRRAVFRHVGERLGAQVVDRHLDLRVEAPPRHRELHRNRAATRQRRHRRGQTAGELTRVQATRRIVQIDQRPLELIHRPFQMGIAVPPGPPQLGRQAGQTRLGRGGQPLLQTSPLLVDGSLQPTTRRRHVGDTCADARLQLGVGRRQPAGRGDRLRDRRVRPECVMEQRRERTTLSVDSRQHLRAGGRWAQHPARLIDVGRSGRLPISEPHGRVAEQVGQRVARRLRPDAPELDDQVRDGDDAGRTKTGPEDADRDDERRLVRQQRRQRRFGRPGQTGHRGQQHHGGETRADLARDLPGALPACPRPTQARY